MPLNIDFQQILLHMLNFVILFAGLSLLLYTPVRRFLQKRRDTIASKEAELAASEKEQNAVLEHAAALEQQAKDKADALCNRIQSEAQAKAAQILEDAKKDAAAIRASAQEEAARTRADSIRDARNELLSLSVKIASAILEKQIDQASNDALVDACLEAWEKTE